MCESVWTLPGFLKRLTSATGSSACCTKTVCKKQFTDEVAYRRELGVFQKDLPYVPKLESFDDKTRTITMERVGVPLGTVWDSGMLIGPIGNQERRKHDNEIRRLEKAFLSDTGLNHNDILYKNVLRDKENKLYLIDFERTSTTYTEPNLDRIQKTEGQIPFV